MVDRLEFRAIQEPLRTIPDLQEYYQTKDISVDVENRVVDCQDLYYKQTFSLPFDYLVLSCSSKTNTFNTPGVEFNEVQDVFFLKYLHHVRSIRNHTSDRVI